MASAPSPTVCMRQVAWTALKARLRKNKSLGSSSTTRMVAFSSIFGNLSAIRYYFYDNSASNPLKRFSIACSHHSFIAVVTGPKPCYLHRRRHERAPNTLLPLHTCTGRAQRSEGRGAQKALRLRGFFRSGGGFV